MSKGKAGESGQGLVVAKVSNVDSILCRVEVNSGNGRGNPACIFYGFGVQSMRELGHRYSRERSPGWWCMERSGPL